MHAANKHVEDYEEREHRYLENEKMEVKKMMILGGSILLPNQQE